MSEIGLKFGGLLYLLQRRYKCYSSNHNISIIVLILLNCSLFSIFTKIDFFKIKTSNYNLVSHSLVISVEGN